MSATPQIAVYFDAQHPGLFIQGALTGDIYPPEGLSALINNDGFIEVYIGQDAQRVLGPVPYNWVTNAAGQPFPSAALTLAYLETQFALTASGGGGGGGSTIVIDEFIASTAGAMTKAYTTLPLVVSVYINGLRQSASEYSVAGVTLVLSAALDIFIGDKITVTT